MSKFDNIAVYGGGSFGTALACQVARCSKQSTLFMRDSKIVQEILNYNTNSKYLEGVVLPDNLMAACELDNIKNYQVLIIAIPSSSFNDAIILLKKLNIPKSTILLIATKGFADNPTQLLSNRVKAILPDNPIAFIIGPNFAKEIAEGKQTTSMIAAADINLAKKLANSLESEFFTVAVTDDVVTPQIVGAIKNIIAIKSGLYKARGYGKNARAGLIGQALAEIKILSQVLGGLQNNAELLLESALLGDLILTCYSKTSRNTKFGYELGISKNKQKFLQQTSPLVEGRQAAKLVLDFIKKYKLNLPIITSVAIEIGD